MYLTAQFREIFKNVFKSVPSTIRSFSIYPVSLMDTEPPAVSITSYSIQFTQGKSAAHQRYRGQIWINDMSTSILLFKFYILIKDNFITTAHARRFTAFRLEAYRTTTHLRLLYNVIVKIIYASSI
jgi:hypothetical protein